MWYNAWNIMWNSFLLFSIWNNRIFHTISASCSLHQRLRNLMKKFDYLNLLSIWATPGNLSSTLNLNVLWCTQIYFKSMYVCVYYSSYEWVTISTVFKGSYDLRKKAEKIFLNFIKFRLESFLISITDGNFFLRSAENDKNGISDGGRCFSLATHRYNFSCRVSL